MLLRTMGLVLEEISNFIVMDGKVEGSGSKRFVHFLSYPDDTFTIPENWKSVIYTSSRICIRLYPRTPLAARKYLRVIQPDIPLQIKLKDKKKCIVTMFLSTALTQNAMFHFRCDNRTVLYTGPFTNFRAFFGSTVFHSSIEMGIDLLYIDNKRANSVENTTTLSACIKILEISRKFPGHKIFINVSEIGYEELIAALVTECKMKVFLNSFHLEAFGRWKNEGVFETDPENASIIVGSEVLSMEEIFQNFTEKKIITVQLIEGDYEIKNDFEKSGLVQVHYSPHPTFMYLSVFIDLIRPKVVKGIYPSCSKLPKSLVELTKYGRKRIIQKFLDKEEHINNNRRQQSTAGNEIDDQWESYLWEVLDSNIPSENEMDNTLCDKTMLFESNILKPWAESQKQTNLPAYSKLLPRRKITIREHNEDLQMKINHIENFLQEPNKAVEKSVNSLLGSLSSIGVSSLESSQEEAEKSKSLKSLLADLSSVEVSTLYSSEEEAKENYNEKKSFSGKSKTSSGIKPRRSSKRRHWISSSEEDVNNMGKKSKERNNLANEIVSKSVEETLNKKTKNDNSHQPGIPKIKLRTPRNKSKSTCEPSLQTKSKLGNRKQIDRESSTQVHVDKSSNVAGNSVDISATDDISPSLVQNLSTKEDKNYNSRACRRNIPGTLKYKRCLPERNNERQNDCNTFELSHRTESKLRSCNRINIGSPTQVCIDKSSNMAKNDLDVVLADKTPSGLVANISTKKTKYNNLRTYERSSHRTTLRRKRGLVQSNIERQDDSKIICKPPLQAESKLRNWKRIDVESSLQVRVAESSDVTSNNVDIVARDNTSTNLLEVTSNKEDNLNNLRTYGKNISKTLTPKRGLPERNNERQDDCNTVQIGLAEKTDFPVTNQLPENVAEKSVDSLLGDLSSLEVSTLYSTDEETREPQ